MPQMRLATMDDLDNTYRLYEEVIDHQHLDRYSPRWTKGVYPTREDLRTRIELGELFVGSEGGRIVDAVVLTREEDPGYYGIAWPSGAEHDEVSVIHLLAVHPDMRGRHLGAEVMRWCIDTARQWGQRAIHLDVVPGNTVAARTYEAVGFELVCRHMVHYEDLGDTELEMYELVL